MHFMIHRDLRTNPVIRWTLAFYGLAAAAFLAFRPWIEAERTGLTPETYWQVVSGDPSKFILPMNRLDFAVNVHTDLFFDTLMAVIFSSILIRLPAPQRLKTTLITILLLFPVIVAGSGMLTHFGFRAAASSRITGFWVLWLTQLYVVAKAVLHLLRPAR